MYGNASRGENAPRLDEKLVEIRNMLQGIGTVDTSEGTIRERYGPAIVFQDITYMLVFVPVILDINCGYIEPQIFQCLCLPAQACTDFDDALT